MDIKGSVALVTGANRGLGLAYTQALLAAGAKKVYAAARDPSKVTTPGVQALKLDITKPEEVAAAAKAAGDVNLLINNAGIMLPGPFLSEKSTDVARANLETNFFGTLALSRAFAPILQANGGGALVNVLSVLSWINIPTVSTYSASKAAVWALTNGIRNELRKQGTLVVAVHSAFIDTDMAKSVNLPKSKPEDVAAQTLKAIEEGREEVMTDDISRGVRRSLAADPAPYLKPAM